MPHSTYICYSFVLAALTLWLFQVQVDDDTLMIFGGAIQGNALDSIKDAYTFKISSNTWTKVTGSTLRYKRASAVCGLIGDASTGKIVIYGDRKTGPVELFDLASGRFTTDKSKETRGNSCI